MAIFYPLLVAAIAALSASVLLTEEHVYCQEGRERVAETEGHIAVDLAHWLPHMPRGHENP